MINECSICDYTHKRCYSYDDAKGVLSYAKRKSRSSVIPKRMYHCSKCDSWHLSSKDNRGEQERHQPLKIINVQESFDLCVKERKTPCFSYGDISEKF